MANGGHRRRPNESEVADGIPDVLERAAGYLRGIAAHDRSEHARRGLTAWAGWLEKLAPYWRGKVLHMSRVAEVLQKLEADRDAHKARADRLQAQLDAQAENVLDAADIAALDKAEAELGGGTPADTTAGGTGPDATAGAAAGDATTPPAPAPAPAPAVSDGGGAPAAPDSAGPAPAVPPSLRAATAPRV